MTPENMPGSYARPSHTSLRNQAPPKVTESDRMWGFTVSPVWAAAIVWGTKRVENRWSKPIAHATAGRRVFIHAGKGPSGDDVWDLYARCLALAVAQGDRDPKIQARTLDSSAIVATCLITAIEDSHGALSGSRDPWRLDEVRYGWRLADVRPIEPIPHRGFQGWWQASKGEIEAAERRWREAAVQEAFERR